MPKKIIVDTDYCTDPGDAGALGLLFTAQKLGLIEVIGIVAGVSYTNTPYAIDAQRKWWGLDPIPIAQWTGTAIDASPGASATWVGRVDNFSYDLTSGDILDSTVAYRTWLAEQTDPVDVITIGYLQSFSALLSSSADGISALSGSDLIAAKVRKVWSMAGAYPSGSAEWNMKGGASAQGFICTASNNVATNCPAPVRWIGFEIVTDGNSDTYAGGTFGRNTSTDLMAAAYSDYSTGRPAWDEHCAFACVYEGADINWTHGTQTVNTTTGANTWTSSTSGKDAYATKAVTSTIFKARMNALIGVDVTANPILSSWGSAAGMLQIQGKK